MAHKSKSFAENAAIFGKNVVKHVKRIALRRETARDALEGVSRDAGKLRESMARASETTDQKRAKKLVERARRRYNEKNYRDAERLLHQAITADGSNPYAYLYLGNILYLDGRTKEASHYWKKADEIAPDSEPASNARRKLQRLEQAKQDTIGQLQDRLGK